MSNELKEKIISIIEKALNEASGDSVALTEADSMETVSCWDSLSFMTVFHAINEAFDIDPDFDDAINYISVPALYEYLNDLINP